MAALPLFMIKVVVNRIQRREIRMAIDYEKLKKIARDIRIDIIRETYHAGSGHPGGSLSAADIMTVLYFQEMNIDPANPKKGRQGQIRSLKGTCDAGALCDACPQGIFSERRTGHLPKNSAQGCRVIPT